MGLTSGLTRRDVPYFDRVEARLDRVLASGEPAVDRCCAGLRAGRGKLLRPSLVLLAASLFPHRSEAAVDVAVAAELIHVASLVHDDVLDAADHRRGLATVNSRWGNHAAVITGDFLFAESFNLLSRHSDAGIVGIMARAVKDMCEGEMRQLAGAYDADLAEEDYFYCIRKKTASLLEACCAAGAALAGAPAAIVEALAAFGGNLGIAFQISDDVLDFVGSRSGKPLCADISQGLVTLPLLRLTDDDSLRGLLKRAFSRRPPPAGRIAELRERVVASGVLEECRAVAGGYVNRAVAVLDRLPGRPARDVLAALAVSSVDRNL